MITTIYIENEIQDHPQTLKICARFPKATKISCDRYTSVFNNNSQNFRLQKQNPSLILARKHQKHVLPTPVGYGVGSERNYYFSHMLNCLYDCRYCFLQGMYRSANYVVFVRTKSTQVRSLLHRDSIPNCVVAYSFSPIKNSQALEHGVPGIEKRIAAMQKLQNKGWKIGLRLDPIIYSNTLQKDYEELLGRIFHSIKAEQVHSISYGMFRLPKPFFKKMVKLYPQEKLFAMPLTEQNSQVSFNSEIEESSHAIVHEELLKHVDESVIYPCY